MGSTDEGPADCPLVGEKKRMDDFVEGVADASNNPSYAQSIAAIRRGQNFEFYRLVLNDHDCGWRAVGYLYFENLVRLNSITHIHVEIARLSSLSNLLARAGGVPRPAFEVLFKQTTQLLRDAAEKAHDCTLTLGFVTRRFNDADFSSSFICLLRLLASAWLKANPERYQDKIPDGLSIDDYRKDRLENSRAATDILGISILIDLLLKPAGFPVKIWRHGWRKGMDLKASVFQPENESASDSNLARTFSHLFQCGPNPGCSLQFYILYHKEHLVQQPDNLEVISVPGLFLHSGISRHQTESVSKLHWNELVFRLTDATQQDWINETPLLDSYMSQLTLSNATPTTIPGPTFSLSGIQFPETFHTVSRHYDSSMETTSQERNTRHASTPLLDCLVGPKKDICYILEDHANFDVKYSEKVAEIQHKYSQYRQIAVDGDGGWRAIVFSYFEALIQAGNPGQLEKEKARLLSLNDLLTIVGDLDKPLLQPYILEITSLLIELGDLSQGPDVTMELLVRKLNSPNVFGNITLFFRLLSSCWLRYHSISLGYENFIPASLGIEQYCVKFLETPNHELDPLGMTILIDILLKPVGLTIDIHDLDRIEMTCVDSHGAVSARFEGAYSDAQGGGAFVHLLCASNHYAILYPKRFADPYFAAPGLMLIPASFCSSPPKSQDRLNLIEKSPTSQTDRFSKIAAFPKLFSPPEPLAVFTSLSSQSEVQSNLSSPSRLDQTSGCQATCNATTADEGPRNGQLSCSQCPLSSFEAHQRPTGTIYDNYSQVFLRAEITGDIQSGDFDCSVDEFDSEEESTTDENSPHPPCSILSDLFALERCEPSPGLIPLVLGPKKTMLVDHLMEEFWAIFEGTWRASVRQCGNTETSTTTSSDSASITKEFGQDCSASKNRKRRRENDDDKPDDEDGRNPEQPKWNSLGMEVSKIRNDFACPYRKHDPRRYNLQTRRACALSPLATVARVKGHLYRHHRVFHCQRCKICVESQQALDSHLTRVESCQLNPVEPIEGVTCEIEKRLRSRKKTYKGQTEAERWKEVYEILFPNEEVPHPYFEPIQDESYEIIPMAEHRELSNYEKYTRRELPKIFRTALETIIDNETQPIEERLKAQLMSLIEDCQERVLSSYGAQDPTASDAQSSLTKAGPTTGTHISGSNSSNRAADVLPFQSKDLADLGSSPFGPLPKLDIPHSLQPSKVEAPEVTDSPDLDLLTGGSSSSKADSSISCISHANGSVAHDSDGLVSQEAEILSHEWASEAKLNDLEKLDWENAGNSWWTFEDVTGEAF